MAGWSTPTTTHRPGRPSQLYEGPTLLSVFNGIYRNVSDYHTNPATKASIEAFCETEQVNGRQPHALPEKHAGVWTGDLEVYGDDQKKVGVTHVSMRYRPLALLRAEVTVEMTGAIERSFTYTRFRNGNLHTFDGPGIYGNGLSYGRALYTIRPNVSSKIKLHGINHHRFLSEFSHCVSPFIFQMRPASQPLQMHYSHRSSLESSAHGYRLCAD